MFLFYLNKYPGMELLNHMVVLFLISGEISILFPVMVVHSQEQCTKASFFPQPHQQLLFLVFWIMAILTGVRWYLMVLICIPWWLLMLSNFSCVFWLSICLLWKNGYSDPLPILKSCCLLLRCCVVGVFCIFWTLNSLSDV